MFVTSTTRKRIQQGIERFPRQPPSYTSATCDAFSPSIDEYCAVPRSMFTAEDIGQLTPESDETKIVKFARPWLAKGVLKASSWLPGSAIVLPSQYPPPYLRPSNGLVESGPQLAPPVRTPQHW